MSRLSIEERFAELEAVAAVVIRPVGVQATHDQVRRRRRVRRSLLSALVFVLLVVPVSGADWAVRHGGMSADQWTEVQADRWRYRFLDEHVGVLLQHSCQTAELCRYQLRATDDGGKTWRAATPPSELPDGVVEVNLAGPQVWVFSAHKSLVGPGEHNVWITYDGGRTFAGFRPEDAPAVAQIAVAGQYQWLCPGTTYFSDRRDCDQQDLVKVGDGPLATQPTLPGEGVLGALTGRDGRVWAVRTTATAIQITASIDAGRSWQRMPTSPGLGATVVSADGRELGVWSTAWRVPATAWRLVGAGWQADQVPAGSDLFGYRIPLVAGAWLLAGPGQETSYLVGGKIIAIPGVAGESAQVLGDGAILVTSQLHEGPVAFLGTGQGIDRQWTKVS